MDQFLTNAVTIDPGVPRQDGTTPYWIHTEHDIARHKSTQLPLTADVAVIGSGITALALTRALLKTDPSIKVTVFEARTLCSGATGRNGGHLVSYGGAAYRRLKQTHGRAMAAKVVDFTFRTVERTKQIITEYPAIAEACEFREVVRIRTFADLASFEEARRSVLEYMQDNPRYRDEYKIIDDPDVLRKQYNVHGVAGAILFSAAALWPYRFISETWALLLKTFPSRLTIEAQTPVREVRTNPAQDNKVRYGVVTDRGSLSASVVAYCTNGYVGHLIPALRGRVYPFRGTMTVQDLAESGSTLHNQGAKWSWSIHQTPRRDEKRRETELGVHYLQQNAPSGYYFFGGEKIDPVSAITGNDAVVSSSSVQNLLARLPRFLGQKALLKGQLISSWSGIMGYTADGHPLVGRLPPGLTKREGDGEFIAAGFNGMGMSLCVSSGEALAGLILGQDVTDWLPEIYAVSEERLQNALTVQNAVEAVKSLYGGSNAPGLESRAGGTPRL